MISHSFYQILDSAFKQLSKLAEQAGKLPEAQQKLIRDVLDKLSVSQLEMQTLLEELHHKNEELEASRLALEKERRRYQDLFEFAPDGYLVTDRDGVILESNSAASKLLHMQRDWLIGRPLTSFVIPEERERFFHWLTEARKGGVHKARDWRVNVKPRHGNPFLASFTVGAVFDLNGEVLGLRWLFYDISWQKKMEEEMLKADKLDSIGILAGGIAHDFSNLLASLMGHISLAKVYKDNPEKLVEKLNSSEKVIIQAKELVQQLFQFSRGDLPFSNVFAIQKVIMKVIDLLPDNNNIECDCVLPPDLFPVEGDEAQITQVIHNILINANQAMPQGGRIHIRGDNLFIDESEKIYLTSSLSSGEYIRISISDSGIGIQKDYLSKIFDPFFTTKKEGSGLGLATSYFIVKNHGGCITVDSQPGKGSTFHLYLPASAKKIDISMQEKVVKKIPPEAN